MEETKRLDEALREPEMVREPAMLEDALAMKPLVRVVRPFMLKVDETVVAPVTLKVEPTEDEALAMNPEKE